MWHQNIKNLKTLADTINKELVKVTCWYMSNKLTINFEKTNAIPSLNSLNAKKQIKRYIRNL